MSIPTQGRPIGRSSTAATCRRAVPLLALLLASAACSDDLLPVEPTPDAAHAAGAAPGTLRSAQGDVVTHDAAVFGAELERIGREGKVLVWLKEAGTPRPATDYLLQRPGSAADVIAVAADPPGTALRRSMGPDRVRTPVMEAVLKALSQQGVSAYRTGEALPVLAVRIPAEKRTAVLNLLLRHPNVDYVTAVQVRRIRLEAGPVGTNPIDTKHTLHRVDLAWNLTRGSGGKIGILDTGFARKSATGTFHDDGLVFGSYGIQPLGFVDDGCDPTPARNGACTPLDDYWNPDGRQAHGTQMAGLAGANDNNIGYVGIAPFALTYSMKVAWNTNVHGHCGFWPSNDAYFCLEDDDFVYAIDYAARNRFHVISMSFTGGFGGDPERAIATARNSYGVLPVAATGNDPGGPAHEPASWSAVVGVAAVDAFGNNLYNTSARVVSGYGGGWTTFATCYKYSYCDAGSPSVYRFSGGTSAATAIVAGIVGLVRSYHPSESPAQIQQRLTATATGTNRVVDAHAAITYVRPVSVAIQGYSMVQPFTTETWSAAVAHGTPPYSYAWYRGGVYVGSGSSYTANTGHSDFELSVIVTDATGGTASDWRWIMMQCTSDPSAILCPL